MLIPAAKVEPAGDFTVTVEGEQVRIPYRIYNPEPLDSAIEGLDGDTQHVLSCLYTRHHDGWVRQRHLRRVIRLTDPWVAPFVIKLVGEYVVELLIDIHEGLGGFDVEGSPQRLQYGRFVAANPDFLDLTARRVTSYWNCYYRGSYPDRTTYPGFQLIVGLRRAGTEQSIG